MSKCKPLSKQKLPLLRLPPPETYRKIDGKWIKVSARPSRTLE